MIRSSSLVKTIRRAGGCPCCHSFRPSWGSFVIPACSTAHLCVASFSTQGTSTARGNSSLDEPDNSRLPTMNAVYTHHVTKIVLQHLQETKSDWLVSKGLDRGLRINANGTAVLHFPPKPNGFESGRVWTTYDTASQQHWLCVHKGKLKGRFLLKDTSMQRPKSFAGLKETDQRIRRVVDEMVAKLS